MFRNVTHPSTLVRAYAWHRVSANSICRYRTFFSLLKVINFKLVTGMLWYFLSFFYTNGSMAKSIKIQFYEKKCICILKSSAVIKKCLCLTVHRKFLTLKYLATIDVTNSAYMNLNNNIQLCRLNCTIRCRERKSGNRYRESESWNFYVC